MQLSNFRSETWVRDFLKNRIIAIITEYTIFKIELGNLEVIFHCLKDEFTFSISFEEIQKELKSRKEDFSEIFLDTLITYCAVISKKKPDILYPVCEFDTIDDLLDWSLEWEKLDEKEKLVYLKKL